MILAKLRGGLSNQLFQYAAARRLAAVHGTKVLIDTSWYENIPRGATPRNYELHQLCISGTIASSWQLIGTDGVRNTKLVHMPIAVFRKVRPRYAFIAQRQFTFDPTILALPDNVCLFGYWVSEQYFAEVAPVIRQEFRFRFPPSPQNRAVIDRMTTTNSVAVHVRRGDYAHDPKIKSIHGLCGADYYERALELINAQVSDARFFIFSDDLEWARRNLPFSPDSEYVDHNRNEASCEDLRLMSHCHHNIIANSGFSWWGAWLNTNPEKVVVGPARWMADPSFDTSDVLPTDWCRI